MWVCLDDASVNIHKGLHTSLCLCLQLYTHCYAHAAHVHDAANWFAVLSCLYVTIKLSPLQTAIMDHSQCHEDNFYFITQ